MNFFVPGKNSRIQDLEQQNQALKEEIHDIANAPNTNEAQQELLSKDLGRARKWINKLEEEVRAAEERMKLAEDLQQNDRELIDILRKQCSSLEVYVNLTLLRLINNYSNKKFLFQNLTLIDIKKAMSARYMLNVGFLMFLLQNLAL